MPIFLATVELKRVVPLKDGMLEPPVFNFGKATYYVDADDLLEAQEYAKELYMNEYVQGPVLQNIKAEAVTMSIYQRPIVPPGVYRPSPPPQAETKDANAVVVVKKEKGKKANKEKEGS